MKRFFLVVLASVCLPIVACGSDEKDKGNAFVDAAEGTWSTSCHVTDTSSTMSKVVITDNEYQLENTTFSDKACKVRMQSMTVKGKYLTGEELAATPDAYNIDITVTAVLMTFNDDALINQINAASFGGHNDWKKDQPQEVDGAALGLGVKKDAVIYDIAKVSGDTLGFGVRNESANPEDQYDASKRPTTVAEPGGYARQ